MKYEVLNMKAVMQIHDGTMNQLESQFENVYGIDPYSSELSEDAREAWDEMSQKLFEGLFIFAKESTKRKESV